MEALLNAVENQILLLSFCFALVFIAGIGFGYINGVADRKTAPPKYTPGGGFEAYQPTKDRTTTPPRRSEDLEDFEKEYRAEVLDRPGRVPRMRNPPPPPRNGYGEPRSGFSFFSLGRKIPLPPRSLDPNNNK